MDDPMTLQSTRKINGKNAALRKPLDENLILRLCDLLNHEGIRYCHWKSNANIEKSLSGQGDLDLLIHRQDTQAFNRVVTGLGFKEAEVPVKRRIPGIRDYYGYDPRLADFVHVHAHFQLTVGHDATKRIHLNIEDDYLKSSVMKGVILVPSVEFEYVILIFRMVSKHLTWDSLFRLESRLNKNERFELSWLREQVSGEKVEEIVSTHFPMVNLDDFRRIETLLAGETAGFKCIQSGQKIARQLNGYSRLNRWKSLWREFSYRYGEAIRHRIFRHRDGKTFTRGGLFIAIVGGDGSGKTTLISSIYPWLGKVFETRRIHLGKPRWSLPTIIIRAFLKVFRSVGSQPFLQAPLIYTDNQEKIKFPGYPWAIREVCTARDRYRTYRKARMFATNGGIIISDRFPLAGIHFMDGPQIERMYGSKPKTTLIKWLINKERSYYQFIQRPDLMVVLKVNPEIAALRKPEEDREDVLARSNEIWTQDWAYANTHVIDASMSKEEVLRQVKSLIWSYL